MWLRCLKEMEGSASKMEPASCWNYLSVVTCVTESSPQYLLWRNTSSLTFPSDLKVDTADVYGFNIGLKCVGHCFCLLILIYELMKLEPKHSLFHRLLVDLRGSSPCRCNFDFISFFVILKLKDWENVSLHLFFQHYKPCFNILY